VPFKGIAARSFVNRERELAYLKRLTDPQGRGPGRHVLLAGSRGTGKTEILRQLYRALFREEKNVVPFYYGFQRAALRASHFARDYFNRFARQFLAFLDQDPSLVENLGVPSSRLVPKASALGLDWLVDLMEDFQDHSRTATAHESILAAVTAPVAAANSSGLSIIVMLDDFHLADLIFETAPNDSPGLSTLFAEGMKPFLTPHILSAGGGFHETLLGDEALRGKIEGFTLTPLQENDAFVLFGDSCNALGMEVADECLPLMNLLEGNPLYIHSTARALSKMQKKRIGGKDLLEGYTYEVTEGDTAVGWSSVLTGAAGDIFRRAAAVRFMGRALDNPLAPSDLGKTARALGIAENDLNSIVGSLRSFGMLEIAGGRIRPAANSVLQDFIRAIHVRESQGKTVEEARMAVLERYMGPAVPSYELTVPMEGNSELVAAKALEQIGENLNLEPETISRLQLALIEAVINAKEHSGSYDKKISLRIIPTDHRIEIVVESPGKAFALDAQENLKQPEEPAGRKRGMGFKLMREVMDEVKVERLDNISRVILVKNRA
jgi:anti-sigma regulatory factor (Ser/Thr protein kinase)/DNA polymerase III delta prime subunit